MLRVCVWAFSVCHPSEIKGRGAIFHPKTPSGRKGIKKNSAHKKSNVRSAFQCQHLSLILSKNPGAKQWKVLILKSVPDNMLFLCDEKSTGGLFWCPENIYAHPFTETEHKSQIFYLNFVEGHVFNWQQICSQLRQQEARTRLWHDLYYSALQTEKLPNSFL